jgi:hypothetical protein
MGLSLFDERSPTLAIAWWTDANSPSGQGLVAPANNFQRIDRILCTHDDTVPVKIQLQLLDSFGEIQTLVTCDMPVGCGTEDGVPPVDLIALAGLTDAGLVITGPTSLQVNLPAALSSGKNAWAAAIGGLL